MSLLLLTNIDITKPSSLLTRLKGYNTRKVSELSRNKAEKIAVDKIITKYKKLYPKAVVYSSTDYRRGEYTSFPIIKVKFKSGSEVSFTLGYGSELDKERFHKKYDAVSETTESILERFNNQPSKINLKPNIYAHNRKKKQTMKYKMIECRSCGGDMPELRLTQYGYNFCVTCSENGKGEGMKHGIPVMMGEGDHTWIETVIMNDEQYKAYQHNENAFQNMEKEE